MNSPGELMSDDRRLIDALIPSVIDAGDTILAIRTAGHSVETKGDNSPVTNADHAAEAILLAAINKHAPDIPVLAEEEVEAGRAPALGDVFFAVDALDGTRDFIQGGPDFTVNIGLIRDARPIAGIVGAPALGLLWVGVVGLGARRIDIRASGKPEIGISVRPPPEDGIHIVASRSHRTPETDDFIARFPGARIVAAGSSLKLVRIAEGAADLYPRLGPTSHWDTAAGDAILTAAGGRVSDLDGHPLAYRPRGDMAKPFLNPWFVATGGVDPFS
ncbi:MAG: 3'(2'),5'-bisphosphate nucleotidase CysQ [Alphaproteobacteria bacterium]